MISSIGSGSLSHHKNEANNHRRESVGLIGMQPSRRIRSNVRQDRPLNHANSYHETKQLNETDIQSDHLVYLSAHDYIPHADESPRKPIIVDGPENEQKFLRLNVGGSSFCFRRDTLITKNEGLLSVLAHESHENRLLRVDAYFESSKEYYFERSATIFHTIYQYYTSGKIHQAAHVCPEDLVDELEFWKINSGRINATCTCTQEVVDNDSDLESILDEESIEMDEFKDVKCGDLRQKIWLMVEDPNSSVYAQIFAALSVFFVLLSICGLILGSLSDLQVPNVRSNGSVVEEVTEMDPHPYLMTLEHICIVWFIFEYTIKMTVTPNHCRTFCQILNIIDLLAILPFLVEMSLWLIGIDTEQLQDIKGALLVVRILRVLRVMRVLKLGRYSSGLQMFGKTLRASVRQLSMMSAVVATGIVFFSTLIYYLEKDEKNTQFYSIPAACWFSIATMATVGYGDITPQTVGGKLVATAAIACGILVLALPITIIVDNFMRVAEAERHPDFGHKARQAQIIALNPKKKDAVAEPQNSLVKEP